MSKMTTLAQLPSVLDEMLAEFQQEQFDVRQEAVQAGADVLKAALEDETPKDTGEMAQSWEIETAYPDHRYVGNTKTAKGAVHCKKKDGAQGEAHEGVPLSNVLEYAENSPHQGFIRRTFDRNEDKISEAMINKMKNGG